MPTQCIGAACFHRYFILGVRSLKGPRWGAADLKNAGPRCPAPHYGGKFLRRRRSCKCGAVRKGAIGGGQSQISPPLSASPIRESVKRSTSPPARCGEYFRLCIQPPLLDRTPSMMGCSALGQQIPSHDLAQALPPVELLVSELGSTAHPRFRDLAQPFRPMRGCVDLCAGTSNALAMVQRLGPIHHSRQILAGGRITAQQLLQCLQAVFSMVGRRKPTITQQFGQLLGINPVALVARFQRSVLRLKGSHFHHSSRSRVLGASSARRQQELYRSF